MTGDELELSTEAEHIKKSLIEASIVVESVNEETDVTLSEDHVVEIGLSMHRNAMGERGIAAVMENYEDMFEDLF